MYVKTLVAAVALNNLACIAFFEMAHTAARVSLGAMGGGGVDAHAQGRASLGLGDVGMLALTAGQVALNGAKTRHVRHPQFALAPTIGRAPGLALSATW